jgi:quercetin dioxygenase-like cupin family protein
MKPCANLLEFTAQAMEDGFEEILQKQWEPNLALEMHTHPYDVRVQVTSGQVRLSLANGAQTYEAGQGFYLARNTEHAEKYGPDGAHFWVARKLS